MRHTQTCTLVQPRLHTCTLQLLSPKHTYTHTHTNTHTHTHTNTRRHTHTRTRARAHTHTHTHTHTHKHTNTRRHTHTRTHARARTHTHTHEYQLTDRDFQASRTDAGHGQGHKGQGQSEEIVRGIHGQSQAHVCPAVSHPRPRHLPSARLLVPCPPPLSLLLLVLVLMPRPPLLHPLVARCPSLFLSPCDSLSLSHFLSVDAVRDGGGGCVVVGVTGGEGGGGGAVSVG